MQFIFASDKEKGYGLLYTDAKRSEAEKVQQILDIPIVDGIDVFGFISFGANNNQPLFFEIKKDISYPRGAYFVHGIYHNSDPRYYLDKLYKQDLFAALIDQEQLDVLRLNGCYDDSPCMINLGEFETEIPINYDKFTELLTRIYRNEKTIIAVNDEYYNHNYSRCLIARLFEFLPPSVIKSCTFVSGALDVGTKNNVQLQIVPASMLVGYTEPYLDITDETNLISDKSEFHSIVKAIQSIKPEDRTRIFDYYELLFNGYTSHYQPKKFLEFWNAVLGDVGQSEKILESYLTLCENPTAKNIPFFIIKNLTPNYQEYDKFKRDFYINSTDAIFQPNTLFEDNILALKKWYVIRSEVYRIYIDQILREVTDNIQLDDTIIQTIQVKLNSIDWNDMNENNEYQRDFCNVIRSVYSTLQNRLNNALYAKDNALNLIRKKLSSDKPLNIQDPDKVKRSLLTMCQEDIQSAAEALYTLSPHLESEIDRLIHRNQKMYQEFEAEMRLNDVKRKLNGIKNFMDQKNILSAEELLLSLLPIYDEYLYLIHPCVVDYLKIKSERIFTDGFSGCKIDDPLLVSLAANYNEWNNLLNEIVTEIIEAPLLLALLYTPWQFMVDCYLSYVSKWQNKFNELSSAELRECWKNIEKAMLYRMYRTENTDQIIPLIISDAEQMTLSQVTTRFDEKLNGKSKKLVTQFQSFWYDHGSKNNRKTELKFWLIAIGAGLGLLVIGMAVITMIWYYRNFYEPDGKNDILDSVETIINQDESDNIVETKPVDATENTDETKPVETTENADETKPVDATENTDETKPAETTENADETKHVDTTENTDETKPAETTENTAKEESVDSSTNVDEAEQVDASENIN